MTPKIITISSKVQDHQHAIKKGSITKQILKKYLRVGFNYKKNSGNNSYTSRTTYQKPNTHSNDKL